MRYLIALSLCLLGSACTTLVDKPNPALISEILNQDSIKNSQGQLETVNILALSDDLRAFVNQHVDQKAPTSKRLRALRDILFSEEHFDIQYESGTTKTAIETYQTRSGNCLSMTNLYIAMARYSGLDANYHVVDAVPQWDHSGDTLILTRHINSTGKLRNGDNYVLDFLPNLRTNRDTAESVSDEYALAIYYNNLGAEAIIAKDNDLATQYLITALKIEPNMADTWNNMGIVQSRLSRPDLSEASFKQAINIDNFSNPAISNLSHLFYNNGQQSKAEALKRRVAGYRKRNPYYRYANAKVAFQKEEYQSARSELEEAIRLKDDEVTFFELLSKVHQVLGNTRQMSDSLTIANYLKSKKNRVRSSLEIRHSGNAIIK
ncbi:MAG: Tfp pilus assembly protein PilF [Candidatus Azotimanducaceae bacterium]|jgi:Tfp pilus assembly protein PilF